MQRKLSKLENVLHLEAVQWEPILRKEIDLHQENHLQLGLATELEQIQEAQHFLGVEIHLTKVTIALQQESNASNAEESVILQNYVAEIGRLAKDVNNISNHHLETPTW